MKPSDRLLWMGLKYFIFKTEVVAYKYSAGLLKKYEILTTIKSYQNSWIVCVCSII